jgi:glycosyltransferase involved in cell wall biosynthesis
MFHRARRTWTRDVDRFVAPSAFARTKLVQGGLAAECIVVRANAVLPGPAAPDMTRESFFYAGRLAPNKGIATLLEAWRRPDMPLLRIAGNGEMAADVRAAAAANPSIEYLGPLPHEDAIAAMRRSIAVIVPSTWYEIQGLVILEAFAGATPVIASDIGAIPEAMRDGETGLLVPPGDAAVLSDRVRWAASNADAMRAMGDRAQDLFEQEFAPERSLAHLLDVYESARVHRRAGRHEARLEPA